MAEFETEYPINGSNALKPSSNAYSGGARIIAFPGLADSRDTSPNTGISNEYEQANAYYRVESLFNQPLSERKIIRNLKDGSLAGRAYGRVSRLEAVAGGIIFTLASFFLMFGI